MRSRDHFAAVGCDFRERTIDVVDPDVWEQTGLARNISIGNPGPAHVSGGIIEARTAAIPVADVPAEYLFIERSRLVHVDRGNLEVTQARPGQQRDRVTGLRHRGAPLVGTQVPGVPREEPVVAIEVLDSVLPFAIDGFVEILHNPGACRFGSLEVCVDIGDEY